MKRIEDASSESLLPFVEECIEPGSVVHTDGWPAYSGLAIARRRKATSIRSRLSAGTSSPRRN